MRAYFLDVVDRFDDRSDAAGAALRAARRRSGLAILNAEQSVQRLLDEHPGDPAELTPLMTLVTYGRRFTASIAALALSRHEVGTPAAGSLAPFADAIAGTLAELAAALREGRAPSPYVEPPELEPEHAAPLVRGRARRLARQLATLHGAVARRG